MTARLKKQRNRAARQKGFLLLVVTLMLGSGCQKKNDQESPQSLTRIVKTKADIEMVCIPAGGFQMGSDAGSPDETPVHRVYVDAFLMDRL